MAWFGYHDEDACGPFVDGLIVNDVYEKRFKCDPYETREEKEEKLRKAERCFYRRVDAMRHSMDELPLLSASNTSIRKAKIDNEHRHPIRVAYSYAKDCEHKLYGSESNSRIDAMYKYATDKVGDYLKDVLTYSCIPSNSTNCVSKCPDIFNWREFGIWKAKPLTDDQMEEELARIPFMDDHDYRMFDQCLRDRLKEVEDALKRSPKHQILKRIYEQINTFRTFLVKTNTNGRELHSRNKSHQDNYANLKKNLNSGVLNRIGNTRRASRYYYKKLRTHIHTRRADKKKKNNAKPISTNTNVPFDNAVISSTNTPPPNKIVYM